jgi:hypothetical protein
MLDPGPNGQGKVYIRANQSHPLREDGCPGFAEEEVVAAALGVVAAWEALQGEGGGRARAVAIMRTTTMGMRWRE